MTEWERSKGSANRYQLLTELCQTLQNVSEEEAQALPDKDVEIPGLRDILYRLLRHVQCCTCH